MQFDRRVSGLALTLAVALVACSGSDGKDGQPGAPGTPGAPVNSGSIAGKLTVAGGAAVPGATVTVVPDVGVTATSAADGSFKLDVPVGVYSVVFAGTNVTRAQVDGVSVVAGRSSTVDKVLVYTPIKFKVSSVEGLRNVGFERPVTLKVTDVQGATGPVTYKWEYVASSVARQPAPALAGATADVATFTTGAVGDIAPTAQFYRVPGRPGALTISTQQLKNFTYNFKVTVSDGSYSQAATIAVSPANMTQGLAIRNVVTAGTPATTKVTVGAGKGVLTILNDAAGASYDWSLTAKPAGFTGDLAAKTTRNPWFIPAVAGTYVARNAVSGDEVVIIAAEYVGLGSGLPAEVGCIDCHATGALAQLGANDRPLFDEWAESWHAGRRLAELNLGGGGDDPAHYGENCLACHTIGYDKYASNGGFDDTMAAVGWKFPVNGPGIDNWTPMSQQLKNQVAIQCESCHGPASAHLEEIFNPEKRPAAFFDAQACAQCHDAVGHHDRYQLWSQSRHGNLATAVDANRSHCTRCHTAQTFAKYVAAGGFDAAGVPAPAVATTAAVEPITCQACHDPHTTRLRIDGSRPTVLPAGFTVAGGGTGQLCMACHNTRNGAKGGDTFPAAANIGGPHHSAQADVLYGKNAYFMTGKPSKHTYVAETCVGCHLEVEAADPALLLPPATTNHGFRAKGEELCASCHGPHVKAEGVFAAFEGGMADLEAAFAAKFAEAVAGKTWTYVDYTTSAVVTPAAAPIAVKPETSHGSVVLFLTFPGGAQAETTLTNVKIDGAPVSAKGRVAAAIWTYLLLEFDGSKGVHNPEFARDLITATKANIVWDTEAPPPT